MSFDATIDISEQPQDEEAKGRWYLGEVIDINDPLNANRVKARVPGLYDSDAGDVPWIGPMKYSPFGTGPNFGFYGAAQVGSKITVVLQEGNPHYPCYIGSVLVPTDIPAEFKDPNVWGFQDPKGNKLIVNMQTGEFKFVHSSGATLVFAANGEVSLTAVKIHLNP